ncbi:MAG: hypothetical protein A2822_01195 [Candidatus Staskawiczbacteria bacterium RIFCSPHIGHO2_01_FULL_41_41]|uniref:Uncharacterized protein n=1 Tax=Candidatus Staskawiczbacteria bacterium RIFCSPHIGHO2_01_FULL_41_41 TaxID=1802203 RepID=A0A1G2HU67_9BACT|nr:MAG: hypothetical protein A2822_01195 [Candidatus Staskawiczbacteria bacterium RIFCSPHIGHO2_01_FULL_41_41]
MQFEIKNIQKSTSDLMRTIGYQPAYFQKPGEVSIVRQLTGNDYPRFHLYIKQSGPDFNFSLHLDQKKPSYEGQTGHNGDYDGEVVEGEAERIKSLLK